MDQVLPMNCMTTLPTESEDTRLYECCVLIPHPLSQKEENDIIKEVEKLFDEAGAVQVAKDVWGRRGLAYTIKGYDNGNYIIYHYEMDPKRVKEIDEAMMILPGVLRHMFVKPPKGYEIVKYSETYEEWLKTRETVEEKKAKEDEEELQRRVAEKAKRQARKAEEAKKEEVTAAPMEEEKITEEIDKLISDDDLDL